MRTAILRIFLCVLLLGCKDKSTDPAQSTTPISAKDKFADVTSVAASHGADMHLMKVVGLDVNPDGTADSWRYEYIDAVSSSMSSFWFHATSNGAVYDSTTVTPLGIGIITVPWIDSRRALDTSEHRGGTGFRNSHQNTTIHAVLNETLVRDSYPTWTIVYSSPGAAISEFGVEINAITGEYITWFQAK